MTPGDQVQVRCYAIPTAFSAGQFLGFQDIAVTGIVAGLSHSSPALMCPVKYPEIHRLGHVAGAHDDVVPGLEDVAVHLGLKLKILPGLPA